eukprot:TRINITY_DN14733_c0_g1_i1.p1 TRINITY_DN14733_c0_g1~~TRINITY_DN14733_c0_g1_i1.p1  ORF type:complete len:226 (-),score=58.39 TRINITY_DN14733_c0_g1_i1:67-744(-)
MGDDDFGDLVRLLVETCVVEIISETSDPAIQAVIDLCANELTELLENDGISNVNALVACVGDLLSSPSLDKEDVTKICQVLYNHLEDLDMIKDTSGDVGDGSDDDDDVNLHEDGEDDGRVPSIVADGCCSLCERKTTLTAHHLIPRTVHKRYLKKGYSREDVNATIMMCRPCHSTVHKSEPNTILAAEYNSLELLLTHPKIQSFIPYIQKQKPRGNVDNQLQYQR